jgi:SAM-dependent methyltransferase
VPTTSLRAVVAVPVLVACSAGPPRARVEPVAGQASLDAPAVIARTHAFMSAVDRADVAAFEGFVAPGFVLFEEQRFMDAARIATNMRRRLDERAQSRTRTCSSERVFGRGGAVVYIGLCKEQFPARGESPATTYEGWNTVVWAGDGEAARVAHWAWQKGGLDAERAMWNETFRKSVGFRREPNRHLVAMVKDRAPGTALDVAMGQGRNAVFLASKRWKVTGVDISDEGIRIANEAAAKQGLAIDTVEHDVDTYDFGVDRWDLVTMIYAGDDVGWIERIKPSIRPGGLFVVECFHDDAVAGTGIGGFGTGELARLFAGWTIVHDEVVEDAADWAPGKTKLVRFAAQKP